MDCMISTHGFDMYIKTQTLGDCKHLTENAFNLFKSLGLSNIKRISGWLQYPVSIISFDGIQCGQSPTN